jgi:hypothetical protein
VRGSGLAVVSCEHLKWFTSLIYMYVCFCFGVRTIVAQTGEYFTMDGVFSFLVVRNSGHLMPMDLPANALDMIDRFIHGRTLADTPLPNEKSYGAQDDDAPAAGQEQAATPAALLPRTGTGAGSAGTALGAGVAAVVLVVMLVAATAMKVYSAGVAATAEEESEGLSSSLRLQVPSQSRSESRRMRGAWTGAGVNWTGHWTGSWANQGQHEYSYSPVGTPQRPRGKSQSQSQAQVVEMLKSPYQSYQATAPVTAAAADEEEQRPLL